MDHDEELERTIALSLMDSKGTANPHPSQPEVIDVEDDDEARFQADIQRAIAASREDSRHSSKPRSSDVSDSQASRSRADTPSASASFLSERAQMEKERIARLKRLRGDPGNDDGASDNSLQPSVKRLCTSPPHERADRGIIQHTPPPSTKSYTNHVERSSNAKVAVIDQLFWEGELRPTANRHSIPRADGKETFRLTEVLGPRSDISFAIMSSYSTSLSWIYEFFDPRTPVIIVSQTDPSGQATIKNVLPNWVMTVPFLRSGRGCQHMKFMLIFYKTGRLRIVISTANLIDYDWRDIENAVWLQDIPLRSPPIPHDPKIVDDFPSIMQSVLRAVNVHAALVNMLSNDHPNLPLQKITDLRCNWDFSKVKVKLIPSIAGKHEGWPSVVQTGHTRLMKAVRDLGLRTGKGKAAKDLCIECQGSSIGTYSTQWVNEFHWSARGESADDWLDEPKSRRSKLPWPNVKILFPSLNTVRNTVLGESGGGTMFCRTNQWEASHFPRELFCDANSTGGRALMHTKMIIATYNNEKRTPFSTAKGSSNRAGNDDSKDKGRSKVIVISDSDSSTESETKPEANNQNEPIGWAYVGSHNFTPSAWGTLSGSGFNPVLNIVNYELGILFPLYGEDDLKRVSCFKRPPRKYVPGKDRPWIQEESSVLRGEA
ncbi:tyrosyl-DNA phosphodiesterase-domain-containing protein [Phlebopus sp. FC_14]|nr:tyrosyl-DNA phosphodiesterase-domain-containing protein [Phlebopus sp. FC_14]